MMDVLVISILDRGLHFTMCMYIKSSRCTIEIYTIIFVNYLSVKLGRGWESILKKKLKRNGQE